MAEVTRTIYVRVMTFDPAQGRLVPVPNVSLLVEHDGWLWDPDLGVTAHPTDANGLAEIALTFDDSEENSLKPFFTIEIPEGSRTVPAGSPAERQFSLPEKWETTHDKHPSDPRVIQYTNPADRLEVLVGLPSTIRVSYTDFHTQGIRNPFALPENTARVYLADYDDFLWIDWLNPDDTLRGFGFDARRNRTIPIGEEDRYPYFDGKPTAPCALDGLPDEPRAWLDPPGAPVGCLGGGSFQTVGPLAVDPNGFVFMIDGNVVRRFYPDGTLCETIEEYPRTGGGTTPFNAPGGIALDAQGHLFVADTGHDRIVVFRPGWRNGLETRYLHVESIDAASLSPALFDVSIDSPRGLAVVPSRTVDGGERLAVANTGEHEVLVFRINVTGDVDRSLRASGQLSVSLGYETKFGEQGNDPAQFQEPVGVASDEDGRIFVCDRQLHRVSRWRPNADRTSYLYDDAAWERGGGQVGAGDGEFDTPSAIAVDTNKKHVYIVESGNRRVQRLDADSGASGLRWQPEIVGTPVTPLSIAVDGRSEVYLGDSANARVLRASPFNEDGSSRADGEEPRSIGMPWTPAGEPEHMAEPRYVHFDPEGRLWVSDSGNNRVMAFTLDQEGEFVPDTSMGAPLTGYTDSASATADPFNRPAGLAMDPDGNLFIADSENHRIRRFSGSPLTDSRSDIGTGTAGSGDDELDHPQGIAFAQRVEPHLYVADRNNHRIQVFTRDGSLVRSLALPDGDSFRHPEDVAVDSRNGMVYVADTGNRRIVQFDAEDGHVRHFQVPTPEPAAGRSPEPCGIFVDEEGKLIIADRVQNSILRTEPDGTLLAFWDLEALLRQNFGARTMYDPELHRMLVFREPARAVVDSKGTMAVADTGQNRVRLVRIHTDLQVNLFDLSRGLERLPDISLRVVTKADWREELGLKLKVGDVWFWDESHDFESEPEEDFALDRFECRHMLREANTTNGAINVMKVVRSVQRWLMELTREDEPEHRWGTPANSRSLDVNLVESGGSRFFMLLDVHLAQERDNPQGRGPDAWDDSTIAHEMTHWVFHKAVRPYPPYTLVGLVWELSLAHQRNQLTSHNQALEEGWSEFVQHFWGNEYGPVDRSRGFPMRPHVLANIVERGSSDYVYLFGGPDSAPEPSFDAPQQALRNEGYIANTLYQVFCALTDPGRIFADSPAFWHQHSMHIGDEQSRRFSRTIWRALRMFPDDPPTEDLDRGSLLYLRNLLDAVHEAYPGLHGMVQSIFELNNLLMPVITVTEGTSTTTPGTPVGNAVAMALLGIKNLIVRVTDERGNPLRGYNLHFTVGDPAWYELSPANTETAAHGRIPSSGFNRVTNGQGIVNVTFEAPPALGAGSTETMTISYQPDFDTDGTFSPPSKEDDRETTLRKRYLYDLRSASKTWGNVGNNFGARVTRTLTFNIG